MVDDKLSRLIKLRDELATILPAPYPKRTWDNLENWVAKATPVVRSDWPDLFGDFENATTKQEEISVIYMQEGFTISPNERRRLWEQSNKNAELVRQRIINFLDGVMMISSQKQKMSSDIEKVIFICDRFPLFVRQLRARGRNRNPLLVEDEYDLQYLLAALFRLYFDDVREEVWTPSYAGGNARMDFLLKPERIIIEAKKTRDSLRDRHVSDQLIIDIERYAEYPEYHTLVCFVYDPDSWISNPRGLEKDLSRSRERINTIVLIRPE